jgi:hypothetical protein
VEEREEGDEREEQPRGDKVTQKKDETKKKRRAVAGLLPRNLAASREVSYPSWGPRFVLFLFLAFFQPSPFCNLLLFPRLVRFCRFVSFIVFLTLWRAHLVCLMDGWNGGWLVLLGVRKERRTRSWCRWCS